MQIAIYCPDRHFLYDGATPDRTGVGGGLTVRIRIAAALAARGHRVSVICNCAREAKLRAGLMHSRPHASTAVAEDCLRQTSGRNHNPQTSRGIDRR